MSSTRTLAWLFAALVCTSSAIKASTNEKQIIASAQNANDDSAEHLNRIVAQLSEITGLKQKKSVSYGRMSKQQLKQFLSKRIKKTLKPEDLHADELTLKLFGLVPSNFDMEKTTVELLTEQAAAFYDYEDKKMFLLNGSAAGSEDVILAHELSHALVDQHFNLKKFTQDGPANDDGDLAHSAVVEGQASWLMLAYQMKEQGMSGPPTKEMLRTMDSSSENSATQYPVLDRAPLYIRESLLFPYVEGTRFFDAVYRKFGKESFAHVFEQPPADTSQVMHPTRYFQGEAAEKPELPKIKTPQQGKQISKGSVGEFDHRILLRQYLGDEAADRFAPRLKGGSYEVLESSKNRAAILRYTAAWESREIAEEYFDAYRRVLQGKWKRFNLKSENRRRIAGVGDNGYFVVWLDGETVNSYEGIASESAWKDVLSAVDNELSNEKSAAPKTRQVTIH